MKIVTLSTFPLDAPRHGGQHRLANICAQYRRGGHEVTAAGVQGSDQYPASANFVPCPPTESLRRFIDNTFLMEDWAIGQWVAHDDEGYRALAQKLPADAELLHVEHPWLVAFARRWADSQGRRVRVLYGSANVEHRLKRRIVARFLGEEHAEQCERRVLECERDALSAADLVSAVSREDLNWIRQQTGTPTILAPNGVADRPAPMSDQRAASRLCAHHRFAMYCASAHPPNIAGFFDIFGRGLGCLSPDERLVVAGGVGPVLRNAPEFAKAPLLGRLMIATGEVADEILSGLLSLAHVIVLPISQGEGTNLKTAEALWAGCHVVATPVAMRGFEEFGTAAGVRVESEPAAFLAAVRDAMARRPLALGAADRQARRVVLWESALRGLVEKVSELSGARR